MLPSLLFYLIYMCSDVWCALVNPLPEFHNLSDYRRGLLGGYASHISRHPYLAAVIYEDQVVCCASIIAPKWLLTSDNCVHAHKEKFFSVRVGSSNPLEGGVVMEIKKFHQHPENFEVFGHDVALIQLMEKIEYTVWAMPIRIRSEAPYVEGTKVVISGWGYASPQATNLSVVEDIYPIISVNKCLDAFPHPTVTSEYLDWTICTGKLGHSPCLWDSGNPMIYEGELVGIFSMTYECLNGSFPHLWTDASWHKRWTRSTINDKRNSDWWDNRKNKNKWHH